MALIDRVMGGARAFRSTIKQAGPAKATANAVAAGAPKAKSTLMQAKDSRVAKYVMAHPYKSAAGGLGAMGAASYVSGRSRRGPGVSKTVGRPTGMYKY